MTPEKDCEMQIIGLTEPVFVEFDTHVVLLTSGYLIKFDHLFKSGQVYDNNSDDEYPLTDGIKNAVIDQLDSENSTMIHHTERMENRKFKKYVSIILENKNS